MQNIHPLSGRLSSYHAVEKLAPLVNEANLRASLRSVADWLDAASLSTGVQGRCHRSAVLESTGEVKWIYPNSNTSELITAWLDLAKAFPDEAARYQRLAIDYAERLISDSKYGFYRGEHQAAWGLAWYWTDDGTYTGGYSMRAPAALARLHEITGNPRLLEVCKEIGETFLARQLENGFVSMVGWCPERGWLSEGNAGSRYGYTVATFATLYKITSDSRYRKAYEQALSALEVTQTESGAFYQHYDPVTLQPTDASIKPHFFSYLFNALEEAHAVFHDERLVAIARRMADYLLAIFSARQHIPYCIDPVYQSDLSGANSAIHDSAPGLLWLYQVTGSRAYLALAQKLWVNAWLHQPIASESIGWHGGIPIGNKRCDVWFATAYLSATYRLLNL